MTLGPGYNMKERSRAEIENDLEAIGVAIGTAQVLSAGSGLKGVDAKNFAEAHAGDVVLTESQEKALMTLAMTPAMNVIRQSVEVPLNENEFTALVSLGYNIGDGALRDSDVLEMLNSHDREAAANAFLGWRFLAES